MAATLLQEASDFLANKKIKEDDRGTTIVELLNSINKKLDHNYLALNSIDNTLRALLKIDLNKLRIENLRKGDKLEDRLEAKPTGAMAAGEAMGKGFNKGVSSLLDLLKSPKKLLLGVATGLTMLLTGLRGLELKALVKLKDVIVNFVKTLKPITEGDTFTKLKDIGKTVANFFKGIGKTINLAFSWIKFEFDETLKMLSKESKIARFVSNSLKNIGNFFKVTKIIFQELFTILKPIGKAFTTAGKFIIGFMKGLLNPITALFKAGKDGSKALSGFGKIFAGLKAFGQSLGKIFLPLGILISTIEGAIAAFREKGSFLDKMQVFFSTAIGDFIGAPLDLLKDIISWMASKLGLESFSEFLDSFSIETLIKENLQGVFDWVQLLFNDPLAAIKQYFNTVIGMYSSIGTWIYENSLGLVFDWIKGTFGIDLEGQFGAAFSKIFGTVTSVGNWIYDTLISPVFTFVSDLFKDPMGMINAGFTAIFGAASSIGDWIYDTAIDPIFTWFKETFEKIMDFFPTGDEVKRIMADSIRALPGGDIALKALGIESEEELAGREERRGRDQNQTLSLRTMSDSELEAAIQKNQGFMRMDGFSQDEYKTFREDLGMLNKEVIRRRESSTPIDQDWFNSYNRSIPTQKTQDLEMMGDGKSSMAPIILNTPNNVDASNNSTQVNTIINQQSASPDSNTLSLN